jgi:hypothetical protein
MSARLDCTQPGRCVESDNQGVRHAWNLEVERHPGAVLLPSLSFAQGTLTRTVHTNRKRNDSLLSYRFNQGVPNQFTFALPAWRTADRTSVAAIFVQDTWTRGG